MSIDATFFNSTTPEDWFQKGVKWRPVPDKIRELPRRLWRRAEEAWKCMMRFSARRQLDPLHATNRAMAEEAGWSESFLKDGFRWLEELKLLRRKRAQGRRKFLPAEGPSSRGDERPEPDPIEPAPLCTPPEKIQETTTTGEASSSSLGSDPEGTDGPDPSLVRALYERACRLMAEVSFGAVADAVAVFTADSVRRMLDLVERRNRVPGNKRKHWGFGLGILRRKKAEGWPEDEPAPARAAAGASTAPEVDAIQSARDGRLAAAWGALAEAEREAIRAEVEAAHPELRRWPNLLEPLYLAELERRL